MGTLGTLALLIANHLFMGRRAGKPHECVGIGAQLQWSEKKYSR